MHSWQDTFFLSTVLHLIAVSYERYNAVVKSPLTYDGTITSRGAFVALIWIVPIPICISSILFWRKYIYNPDVCSSASKDGRYRALRSLQSLSRCFSLRLSGNRVPKLEGFQDDENSPDKRRGADPSGNHRRDIKKNKRTEGGC